MNNEFEQEKQNLLGIVGNIWGLILLKGIILILLGIALFSWPTISLHLLIIFLGVFFLADGIVDLITSIFSISKRPWFAQFVKGVLQIIIAVIVLKNTTLAITSLFVFLSFIFIISGIVQIIGINHKIGVKYNRTLEIVSGILTLIVGILLMFKPVLTGLALTWIIGIYAVIAGIIIFVTALEIRHELKKHIQKA